jgi:hypothetical protein
MVWPVKTHPAHSTGLESKTNSSDGEGFSLDRSFYRTDISNSRTRRWTQATSSTIPTCRKAGMASSSS